MTIEHHLLANNITKAHGVVWQTVADSAALAALTISAEDVSQRKIVLQTDNGVLWVPVTVLPTFQKLFLPSTGDYVLSQIGNDSLVPGTTGANALNNVRDIPSVDVATTGNVALTGVPANIDAGYVLVNGVSVIFVWLNTDPKENGPYLYNSGGAWSRASGWTTSVNFRPGQPFQIANGTSYGGRTAYFKNAIAPTLGVTNLLFNVNMDVQTPTALNQFLAYDLAANRLVPTGIKSALLADADATIAIGTAYNFILSTPLTANRTITLDSTGAFVSAIITIDIRVTLGFTLAIVNSIGNLFTFLVGSKWIGGFTFAGGNWGGPTGVQAQV